MLLLLRQGGDPKKGRCHMTSIIDFLRPIEFDIDGCNCWECITKKMPGHVTFFPVCRKCGNKRCPHQESHRFKCTNSNEPGQVGELIEDPKK